MTETSFHNMSVSFWYTFTSFGHVHGSGLFRNPIDCSLFQDGHFFLQISWKSIQKFLNNQRQKQKDKENRTNLITHCFAANSAFYPHSDRRQVRPKCGDALRLESKGRYCSFRLWIKVWITGKTMWSLVNACDTSAPRDHWMLLTKRCANLLVLIM